MTVNQITIGARTVIIATVDRNTPTEQCFSIRDSLEKDFPGTPVSVFVGDIKLDFVSVDEWIPWDDETVPKDRRIDVWWVDGSLEYRRPDCHHQGGEWFDHRNQTFEFEDGKPTHYREIPKGPVK